MDSPTANGNTVLVAGADDVATAMNSLSDAAKAGVVAGAIKDLGDAETAGLANTALGTLPAAETATVVASAMRTLPDGVKADATIAAIRSMESTAKDEMLDRLLPDQRVTNDIWRWIVATFAFVLAGAMLALVAAVFIEADAASMQMLLTIFTTTAGILAGFVSGRASTSRTRI